MSKFAKLTSLLSLIMITFIAFMVMRSIQFDRNMEVTFTTQDGQSQELDLVSFSGNLEDSSDYTTRSSFEFSGGEITYLDDVPRFKRMDLQFNPVINHYITNYRSFMRGKSTNLSLFSETEEHLVYAAMDSAESWRNFNSSSLSLSILNKETKDEESYTVHLSEGGYNYEVVGSSINYPDLTVYVQASSNGSVERADAIYVELFVYHFDFENPSSEIDAVSNLNDFIPSQHLVQLASSYNKTNRYKLFRSIEEAPLTDYDSEYIGSGYYAYDIRANEVLPIPSFDGEDAQTVVLTEEESIYVGQDLGEIIEWHEYNPSDESLTLLGQTQMASGTIGREAYDYYYYGLFNNSIDLIDGKVYTYENDYSQGVTRPTFQVIDFENQENLFIGQLDPVDQEQSQQVEFYIYEYALSPFIK